MSFGRMYANDGQQLGVSRGRGSLTSCLVRMIGSAILLAVVEDARCKRRSVTVG